MKASVLLAIALFISGLGSQVFACSSRCVNTSGNAAYDSLCAAYGAQGLCGSQASICTEIPQEPVQSVSRCQNTSGNPAYDSLCAAYGTQGLCGSLPNICTVIPGQWTCR